MRPLSCRPAKRQRSATVATTRAARVSTEKPDVYPDCEAVGVEVFGLKPDER